MRALFGFAFAISVLAAPAVVADTARIAVYDHLPDSHVTRVVLHDAEAQGAIATLTFFDV